MEDDTKQYNSYIREHLDEIVKMIDDQFLLSKDFIRAKLIKEIKTYLSPIPVHYEWMYDGCQYDRSGILIEDGYIDINQTISEFLENEYNGNKTASFMSGCGFFYDTYGNELSYCTFEIAGDILYCTVRRVLEESYHTNLSDESFEELMDEWHDEIYTNCLAYDFFSYEPVIEFVGIGDIKLFQLIEKK